MSNNRTLILKKTDEFAYFLTAISKEECEEIQALMRMNAEESDKYPLIANFEACAHISEVTEAILKHYVPVYHKWNVQNEVTLRYKDEQVTEYVCYAKQDRNPNVFSSNVRIHEDRISAFKGACMSLNTEFFYIERKPYLVIERDKDGNPLQTLHLEIIDMGEISKGSFDSLKPELDKLIKKQEDECTTDKDRDSEVRSENPSE